MATQLIMPRLDQQQSAFFQAQNQEQPYQWQQQQVLPTFPPAPQQGQGSTQISPLSTSGSASPTSPVSTRAYHARQIRPLYMPAVLRPTEHPSKPLPTRIKTDSSDDEDDGKTIRSNSSFITLSGALGRLSRRSTGDSSKCVDGDWNLAAFPQPTGLPSREHWKPDHESSVCDHSTCRRTFSYFTRRHHCRCCGNIFCDFHSSYEVPLDENARYNPRGTPVRACAHCHGQFKEWRSRANSQDSSITSSQSTHSGVSTPGDSPLSTSPIGCRGKPTPPSVTEVAVSVPRDWNWSTF